MSIKEINRDYNLKISKDWVLHNRGKANIMTIGYQLGYLRKEDYLEILKDETSTYAAEQILRRRRLDA